MATRSNIVSYIQQQLRDAPSTLLQIQRFDGGGLYPRRYLVGDLTQAIDSFLAGKREVDRWFVLTGLRGVGKTTVLAQVYTYLNQVKSKQQFNLLYISFDEPANWMDANLGEMLDGYQEILGSSWPQNPDPTFIFIDEVQSDPRWARFLKAIYDKSRNVFFICTGSSASALQIDADVAGRRGKITRLHPLNFSEYQFLTNGVAPAIKLKADLLEACYYSDSAASSYQRLKELAPGVNRQWVHYDRNKLSKYLTIGGLPLYLRHKDSGSIYTELLKMVSEVVSRDLSSIHKFSDESKAVINRLLFLLATAGDIIAFNTLTEDLKTNSRQLWLMFDALVKSGLLIKVPAYGSHFTTIRRPARYQFMSSSIRSAIYNIVGNQGTDLARRGILLEDAAALHYYRELVVDRRAELNHPHDSKQASFCDFILKVPAGHQLAIEFGLGDKGVGQVSKTMAKIQCRYGLVFANTELRLSADKSVVSVPLDYFFLM